MTRLQRLEARSLARRMRRDIESLMRDGTIPDTVTSFPELHEYIDANTLGDTEAMLEEGMPMGEFCDIFNAAIESVDYWLQAGSAGTSANGC